MNFDEAFKKYMNGNPTNEEREYVENELSKAKALSNLLDDDGINIKPAPIVEADAKSITKAKKTFKFKIITISIISVISVLVILASCLGGVFGAASAYAKEKIVYDRYTCCNIAVNYIAEKGKELGIVKENLTVLDSDPDFEYETPIKESFYAYKVWVKNNANGKEYLVYVPTITGDSIFLR